MPWGKGVEETLVSPQTAADGKHDIVKRGKTLTSLEFRSSGGAQGEENMDLKEKKLF